jgi:ATP-dependent Lhr-like helicase
MRWQHVEPETRLHGAQGLLTILTQLQGFEAAATAWESKLLPARVADYSPEMLDLLCFSGEIAWARLTAPASPSLEAARRVVPTRAAPITFFRREDAGWLLKAAGWSRAAAAERISPAATQLMSLLEARGASFFNDLARANGEGDHLLKSQVEDGLWELATAGLVTADGFDNLRALLDPKRRRAEGKGKNARPRHSAGRWSLISELLNNEEAPVQLQEPAEARAQLLLDHSQLAEMQARQLLRRYGVIFRGLMARESATLPWHDLLRACRRLEARGEIRGGRFVSGFSGEQYALPEAVEALRAARRLGPLERPLVISASDPLNLAGILVPGERVPAQAEGVVDLVPAAAEGAGATARSAEQRSPIMA